MTYATLKYEVEDRVLTLTLNRPEQLNAFTVEMANELVAAFERASEDDAVDAVIVTGEGRAFCAGMDLSTGGNVFGLDEDQSPTLADLHERLDDPAIFDGVRDTGGRVTLAIFNCKKPVIAAINGPAVGIGATMTLAMDIRMASDKARIGFVFGRIGIVLEACSSWFLPRIVGVQQAMEWIYTADILDAQEALRGRLVRSVHAPDALMADARALAHRFIDGKSPVATAMARQMLLRNSAQTHPLEAHRIDSLAMFYASVGDGKEGVAAFLEKRTPDFKGVASKMPPFFDEWVSGRGSSS
ncbi:MAG: crotonase/enoyl-CoA hydratase family protein [Phenylobacterium sp.]|uniref:crotonase/enoyl-CoA hydratase family protein n=1 Tax=Phenylobacterium sp. TaxID=1871053 RepID=UPI0027334F34|nr:crotonase/enoyl-CoA hydratase family protein [Phenylobacterium sp.]MDP3174868.1 crotonase/enoyl-CoA hydratase family protein [Phenylobacterium sp.]